MLISNARSQQPWFDLSATRTAKENPLSKLFGICATFSQALSACGCQMKAPKMVTLCLGATDALALDFEFETLAQNTFNSVSLCLWMIYVCER